MASWGQIKNQAEAMEQLLRLRAELRDAERDYNEAINSDLKEQARLKIQHLKGEIQGIR